MTTLTAPEATLALSLTWINGPRTTYPGTPRWVRDDLAGLADALDMLVQCGPTIAAVRAVDDAWRAIEEQAPAETPSPARRLAGTWPHLVTAIADLRRAATTEGTPTP